MNPRAAGLINSTMWTSALPPAPDGWFSAAPVAAGTDSEEGLLSHMATVKRGKKSPPREAFWKLHGLLVGAFLGIHYF